MIAEKEEVAFSPRVGLKLVVAWPPQAPRGTPPRGVWADGVSGVQGVGVRYAEDGRFLGYGAGRVQPEGSGYLDFIAITPDARGTGAGLGLLATICRWIIEAAPQRLCPLPPICEQRFEWLCVQRIEAVDHRLSLIHISEPTRPY